jgi:hypothetical protein
MIIRNRLTGVEAEIGESDKEFLGADWDVVGDAAPKSKRKSAAPEPESV